jgi:hypothetical protein
MQLIAEGGLFTLLALGATGVLALLCPVLFALQVVRVRLPSLFFVPLVFVPAVLGAVGTWLGVDELERAIGMVGGADLPSITSMGLASALLPTLVGTGGTIVLAVSFGAAEALGIITRPGRVARLTAENAFVAGLLTGLGVLGGWFSGGMRVASMAFAVGVVLSLSALRFPVEEEKDVRRVGAGRLTIAALGVCALSMLLVFGGFYRLYMYLLATELPMQAAASARIAAVEGAWVEALGIAMLCGLFALGTPFVVGPGMRALDVRGMLVAGMTAALILLVPLVEGVLVWRIAGVWDWTRSHAEQRSEALADLGVALPDGVEPDRVEAIRTSVALTFTGSSALLAGEPVDVGGLDDALNALGGPQPILLEASADTPLATVAPFAAILGRDARWAVCLVVRTPIGLGCMQIDVLHRDDSGSTVEEPRLAVLQSPDGWFWRLEDETAAASGSAPDAQDLVAALGSVLAEHPEVARASIWMASDATVGDLVQTAQRLQKPATDYGYRLWPRLVWRTEPPDWLDTAAGPASGYAAVALATLRENEASLERCMHRERVMNPGLTGSLEAQLSIGPDGRVIRARITRSSLDRPGIEQCVRSELLKLAFPAPESGQVEVVRLPWSVAL